MAETTVPAQQEQPMEPTATREESRYLVPPVDIYETKEGLVVVADLPGATQDSIEVHVENDVLTLKAHPAHTLPGQPVFEEFELLDYYRQFELPEVVDQEKIEAQFKHGVLTLRLPKAERAKPRQIQVSIS